MSSPGPSRRTVLRGTTLAVAVLAVPVGGCARDDGPDELEGARTRALADAALATATFATFGALAARLTPVAETRRAHADALDAEIRRARPDRAEALDTAPAPGAPPPPPTQPAALGALRDALGAARDEGRTLALRLEPHRAAMLASLAGACAAHAEGLA